MQSQITAGQVAIMLDGEEFLLSPTMDAILQVNRQYDGFANARAKLIGENIDAVAFIIRAGLPERDRPASFTLRHVVNKVCRNGITGELLIPLINFVNILGNGGKPLNEDDGSDQAAGDRRSHAVGGFRAIDDVDGSGNG